MTLPRGWAAVAAYVVGNTAVVVLIHRLLGL